MNIRVTTERPTILKFNDKTYQFEKKCKINVDCSKDSLIFVANSDSSKRVIKLFPMNSTFYKNKVSSTGHEVTRNFNKFRRYNFQKYVFIDYNSTKNPPAKFRPTQKGQVNFMISIPYVNSFYLQPQNEPLKVNTGFWGISTGMEYYYKKNKFVNITVNGATDFFVPVPAAVDIFGEFESMASTYISLTNNYRINRFSVGYGLNYSNNVWKLNNTDPIIPLTRELVNKSSQSIGLTFNSYLQLSKHFYLGLIYRPTFLKTFPVHKMEYEHLITIDCAWKWKIK